MKQLETGRSAVPSLCRLTVLILPCHGSSVPWLIFHREVEKCSRTKCTGTRRPRPGAQVLTQSEMYIHCMEWTSLDPTITDVLLLQHLAIKLNNVSMEKKVQFEVKTVWGLPEIQVLIARCHRLSHICLGRGICLLTKACTNFVPAAQPRRCRTFRRFGSAMVKRLSAVVVAWKLAYLQRTFAGLPTNVPSATMLKPQNVCIEDWHTYIYILPIQFGKLYRFDACPCQTLDNLQLSSRHTIGVSASRQTSRRAQSLLLQPPQQQPRKVSVHGKDAARGKCS